MMVKIYQNQELNDIMFGIDALGEWKEIAEELKMDKQLAFIKESNSPIPYPFITISMSRVFKTLCPTVFNYKEYDLTPIPLEVMKQISYSIKEAHFRRIEIWADNKAPDPFVIGITESYYLFDDSYSRIKGDEGDDLTFVSREQAKFYAESTDTKFKGINATETKAYLIARWGDEVKPIETLKDLAKDLIIEKYAADLKIEIEEKTQALKLIQQNAILYLNGDINESQLKGSKW